MNRIFNLASPLGPGNLGLDRLSSREAVFRLIERELTSGSEQCGIEPDSALGQRSAAQFSISAADRMPPDGTPRAWSPLGAQTYEGKGWSIALTNTPTKPPSVSLESALAFQPFAGYPTPIIENDSSSNLGERDLDIEEKHSMARRFSQFDELLPIHIPKPSRCISDSWGSFRCW